MSRPTPAQVTKHAKEVGKLTRSDNCESAMDHLHFTLTAYGMLTDRQRRSGRLIRTLRRAEDNVARCYFKRGRAAGRCVVKARPRKGYRR